MVTPFPVIHQIDVQRPAREVIDRYGDRTTVASDWETVKVIGWAVSETQEATGDSVLRTIDVLELYTPESLRLDPATRVRTPDGHVWHIQGNAQDFTHGPYWNPQALVYRCRKVTG